NKFIRLITSPYNAVWINGQVSGVVYNNYFYGDYTTYTGIRVTGNQGVAWENHKPSFAATDTSHRVYIEDNYFEAQNSMVNAGQGGRYVFRYNTYNYIGGSSTTVNFLDAHGNQPTTIYATQV